MSRKFIFLSLFFSLFTVYAFTQELYEPRNIKNAYKNQTRSRKGAPGQNYWQNRADYTLKINVSPPDRSVRGTEEIVYTNNSPDTLKGLHFKLVVNHHKPQAPRANTVTEDYLSSGVHIDAFKENGTASDWDEQADDGTDKWVRLRNPLAPGDKVSLSIDWHYVLSKQSGREGVIEENTFFIAYFYPRVAVYDDYIGWDQMPHTGAQEFYNDFNDYTVEVTVPENFIVWGTGVLQNPDEVLSKKLADRFRKSKTSEEVVHIVTQQDLAEKQITRPGEHTWTFKAQNVPDVALAVSNNYKWDAGSLKIGDRSVSIQSAYDEPSKDFEQMVGFIKHALSWFSQEVPGVAYPYPTMTVVRGFADMEFPMMANDSSMPDIPEFTQFVAEHEIAHTYFPFYMGTNETRYGFMDEGWATTLEYLIGVDNVGEANASSNFKNFRVKSWTNDDSFLHDLPIIIPTNVLSRPAMSDNEYGKAALAYLALRDLLGPEKFKKALHVYMDRWNGKHPTPWDFFYTFNDVLNEDLNWFWTAWFFSYHYIDFAIDEVNVQAEQPFVKIKNTGGFPAPFDLLITDPDGNTKQLHQSPAIWKENLREVQIDLSGLGAIETVEIENGIFMDAHTEDNSWKR